MFILKYAWLNIRRTLGKNLLIGIIIAVVAFSSCLALSIQQAAETTRESGMNDLEVTANICVDRAYIMEEMKDSQDVDKDSIKEVLKNLQGLSLKDCEKYSEASSVEDFYYTEKIYLNGDDNFDAIGSDEKQLPLQGPQGLQDPSMALSSMAENGDFAIIGYDSDKAMSDFKSGIKKIKKGQAFAEDTGGYQCIISENLAIYNDISVGEKIKLKSTKNSAKNLSITLKVVGTFETKNADNTEISSNDPDNEILTSSKVIEKIIKKINNYSDINNECIPIVTGTYTFERADDYFDFEKQVADMGLSKKYTVVSNDISSYEYSLLPLNNLKKYSLILLLVILLISSIVIVVISMININSRKKEIGILAALGMKRNQVLKQFIAEVFIVAIVFMCIGATVGGIVSVPVTNSLLESQVTAQENKLDQSNDNFGRETNNDIKKPIGGDVMGNVQYVNSVVEATNFKSVVEAISIALVLALFASMISIIFIIRCEPGRILSSGE